MERTEITEIKHAETFHRFILYHIRAFCVNMFARSQTAGWVRVGFLIMTLNAAITRFFAGECFHLMGERQKLMNPKIGDIYGDCNSPTCGLGLRESLKQRERYECRGRR
jgi:hypothetical protein